MSSFSSNGAGNPNAGLRPPPENCSHRQYRIVDPSLHDLLLSSRSPESIAEEICSLDNQPHAVFARENYLPTSNSDRYYKYLVPALRLASLILVHDRSLVFWHGMAARAKAEFQNGIISTQGYDHRFHASLTLSSREKAETERFLDLVARHCDLACNKLVPGEMVLVDYDLRPIPEGHLDSLEEIGPGFITINPSGEACFPQMCIRLSRRFAGEAAIAMDVNSDFDVATVRKLYFQIAMEAVKGFACAAHMLLFGSRTEVDDHYFNDERLADVGRAFENHILGGCLSGGFRNWLLLTSWPSPSLSTLHQRVIFKKQVPSCGPIAQVDEYWLLNESEDDGIAHLMRADAWTRYSLPSLRMRCCTYRVPIGDEIDRIYRQGRPLMKSNIFVRQHGCIPHTLPAPQHLTIAQRVSRGEDFQSIVAEVYCLTTPLHPLLCERRVLLPANRPDLFHDVEPAFRLASNHITHPTALRYWHGMLDLYKRCQDSLETGIESEELERFQAPGQLTVEEEQSTLDALTLLSEMVSLGFGHLSEGVKGYTRCDTLVDWELSHDKTTNRWEVKHEYSWVPKRSHGASKIVLNWDQYVDPARSWRHPQSNWTVPQVRALYTDMAHTLSHEMAHAIGQPLFVVERRGHPLREKPKEKFFGNENAAEHGFSFHHFVLNGIPAFCNSQGLKVRYTLSPWPTASRVADYAVEREGEVMASMDVCGPVPDVHHVYMGDNWSTRGDQRWFEDEFWAAKPPTLNIRCCLSEPNPLTREYDHLTYWTADDEAEMTKFWRAVMHTPPQSELGSGTVDDPVVIE